MKESNFVRSEKYETRDLEMGNKKVQINET